MQFRRFYPGFFLIYIGFVVWFFTVPAFAQTSEEIPATPDCLRVQQYMDAPVTPDRFIQGGGLLVPDMAVSSEISDLDAGDRWVFGGQGGAEVTFSIDSTIPLQVHLYQNMNNLLDTPVDPGSRQLRAELPANSLYTLVVSRQEIVDTAVTGSYTLSVSGAATVIEENQLVTIPDADSRFIFYNRLLPAQFRADIVLILNGLTVDQLELFSETSNLTLTPGENAAQATLTESGYHVLEITGGTGNSFTLTTPDANVSRIATIEAVKPPRWDNYPDAPQLTLENGIVQFQMEDGTRVRAAADTFSSVSPIPIFFFSDRQSLFRFARNSADEISLLDGSLSIYRKGSTGFIYVEAFDWRGSFVDDSNFQNFRLISGEEVRVNWNETESLWVLPSCIGIEFTGGRRLIAEAEKITALQTQEEGFTLNATHVSNGLTYDVNVDWQGLAQVVFENATVQLRFGNNRIFRTDRLNLTVRLDSGKNQQIILADNRPFVATDWNNINRLVIEGMDTLIEVQDERGTIRREGREVSTLETAKAAVRIQWADNSQTLLLPESEDFIEIETLAELPGYDPTALPGERGFLPANFNNTGLECYPVTTALDFNCAGNGPVNPANGNLVYSVTDLFLPGYSVDLALTRTYNSRNANLDGPFGAGWSTDYVLDFAVPYDENSKSRLLTETTPYKMALDLTQAPRGQVIFTTPTGSKHLFAAENPGQAMTSTTLPGWQIAARSNDLGDNWRVYRNDGLAYTFDRAGRLTGIDYPQQGELEITRLQPFPEAKYRLQDSALAQYMILEFDGRQHITRSALYDGDDSLLAETLYEYDSMGRLIRVQYDNHMQATYEYDAGGNLIAHSDWRAPVARDLYYAYDENHRVQQISFTGEGTPLPDDVNLSTPVYRRYSYQDVEGSLITTITDEWGGTESWQYSITFDPSTAYRLMARSIEGQPVVTYQYDIFLITRVAYPSYNQDISYQATGAIDEIRNMNGLIGFQADYQIFPVNGHPISLLMGYRNNTETGLLQAQYDYDSQTGEVTRYTDANGLTTTIVERHPVFGLPTILEIRDDESISRILLAYDDQGYLIQRTDTLGVYQFEWDSLGRLTGYIDPLSRTYQVTYIPGDSGTVCMVVTDPLTVKTTYCYDGRQNLSGVEVRESDGTLLQRTTYTYDAIDRLAGMVQFLDESGTSILTTTYEYLPGETSGHWILKTTDPYGRIQIIEYDIFDRVVRTVDFLNRETRYRYEQGINAAATRVIRTEATGLETQFEYNLAGQLCAFRFEDTAYEAFYSEGGGGCNQPQRFITRLASPFMSIRFENYDAAGRPGQISFSVDRPLDSTSLITPDERFAFEYSYDRYGRLTAYNIQQGTSRSSVNQSENVSLKYIPGEDGSREVEVSRIIGGDSQNISYFYDAIDRLLRIETADGTTLSYRYTDRPDLNRLEVVVNFSGNRGETEEWHLLYDGAGNLREWLNQDGKRTIYTYDALSRLLEVRANDLVVASYAYNELSQVLLIRNQYQQEYRYVYNALGLLTTERDFNDVVTVYTYDQFGNVSSVTDALGYRISYLYDEYNRLTGIIDASGREVAFNWDEARAGRLEYTSGNRTIEYYFDLMGRLWQVQDEAGSRHYLRYDGSGRLTGFWPYAGNFTYEEQYATLFAYGVDNVIAAIDGPENTVRRSSNLNEWDWQFEHDHLLRLTGRLDPNGHLMAFDYDALGRLFSISASENYNRLYAYSPGSITITGGNFTRQLSYDELYRLTSETLSRGTDEPLTTTYTYTDTRNFVLTDPFGARKLYIYPQETDIDQPFYLIVRDAGYAAETLNELSASAEQTTGRQYRYTVNARGELVSIQRDEIFTQDGEITRYRTEEQVNYDPSGRPIRYVDAQNNPFTFAYDTEGNLIAFQTPDGVSSFYQYDVLNRLLRVENPGNQVLELEYNPQGEVETISLNGTELESYRYNRDGTLQARQFDDSEITYEYDAAGNIIGWTNGDNTEVVLERTNDAFARLIQVNGSTFSYDDRGQVTLAENNSVSYRFTIDPAGRLLHINEDNTRPWNYTYDPEDGRSYTLMIGRDHVLQVEIDDALRLQRIATDRNSMVISYEVRLNENFIQVEIIWGANEDEEKYETQIRFNRLGQVVRVVHNRDELAFNTLTFNYDLNYLGLPQAIDEPGYEIFVGYDAAYRPAITRWLYTGLEDPARQQDSIQYAFTITYDRSGNRRTELIQSGNETHFYQYESEGRRLHRRIEQPALTAGWVFLLGLSGMIAWKLRRPQVMLVSLLPLLLLSGSRHQQPEATSRYEYQYNADGHVDTITEDTESGNRERNFTYDAHGRLIKIQNGARSSTFSYDAFGRLISWDQSGPGAFEYRYNGDRLVEITTAGGKQVVVTPSDGPLLLAEGENSRWALYDGLDSLRQSFIDDYPATDILTNQNVFGVQVPGGQTEESFQFNIPFFQGMLYDPENEIYIRLDGRAYDPVTGRYLQRDILGPDASGNLYSYQQERFILPVLKQEQFPFFEGLRALHRASTRVNVLYSEDILEMYLPDFSPAWQDTGLNALKQFNEATISQQTRFADFPAWLGYSYNPSGVLVDERGNFQLNAPRENSSAFISYFPSATISTGGIWSPEQLDWLLNTETVPPTWHSESRSGAVWSTDAPLPFTGLRVPAQIEEFLSHPLSNISHYTMLFTALENLPIQDAETWLMQIDEASLPSTPEVWPETMQAWLSNWFTDETIPVWQKLREIYRLPEPPGPEMPSLGLTDLEAD